MEFAAKDCQALATGPITFTKDGVIIPISSADFIMLERWLPQFKQTGPPGCPTLHLEKDGIAICVVPKEH